MFEDFKCINAEIKEHRLSLALGVVGCAVMAITFPVFLLSIVAVTAGNVTITPPEATNPIIEAGWGCIFNRWFWATMLVTSILGQIFGNWAHPESQLRRKIGNAAVREYQQTRGWAWK